MTRPDLHGRATGKTDVFVFGSNLAGRHGKGAALWALQNRGAVRGVGVGRQGMCYAIPTKDDNVRTLGLERIHAYVRQFLAYARAHPHETYELTPIGCGLAGYTPQDIAPMFADAPLNVSMPQVFIDVLANQGSQP